MLRAMETRAASICLVSSQQRSRAIKPYSPNATVLPRVANPARLPRCILRNFTLAGCNGIKDFSLYLKIRPQVVPLMSRSEQAVVQSDARDVPDAVPFW